MHRLAHLVIAAEREGNIGNASRDFRTRQVLLDPSRGVDEVEGVVVVLLDPGRDRQDIGIKNDVVGIEADLINKDTVSPLADADLLIVGRRLAFLIERHHHHGRAVFHDVFRVRFENLLALLERDRVHDPLPLQMLQALLKDLPFRGIHHDRHPRDIRLALEQVEVLRHHRLAVDEAVVEADIDHIRAVRDLLAGDLDRRLQITGAHEFRELRRARHVRPFPDH